MIQQNGTVLQDIARQLLEVSPTAKKIHVKQLELLGLKENINSELELFEIVNGRHCISFLNGLFEINFFLNQEKQPLVFSIDRTIEKFKTEKIEYFLVKKLNFHLSDQGYHRSIELREKAKELREIIFDSLLEWVNAEYDVIELLNELTLLQAQSLDHLFILEKFYHQNLLTDYVSHRNVLSDDLIELIKKACRIDIIYGQDILYLQQFMQQIELICTQAEIFLPPPLYRVCEVLFLHHFNLSELAHKQKDIKKLWYHAEQTPNLLGFIQLMDKSYWGESYIFAKSHFYSKNSKIWINSILPLPIFDHKKVVNWIYRQDSLVLDWLSQYLQYQSVRVSVTALSFIDCSQYHPNIILSTLQYFQYVAARIVVYNFAYSEDVSKWIKTVTLKEQQQFNLSQPSILYLDEWVELIGRYCIDDVHKLKKIFLNLSRIMQAYMQHLQLKTQSLSHDLIYYIQTEKQQERNFHLALQRENIKLDDFRECFYLRERHLRESVFSSYVRDFLLDYLAQHIMISKHITWLGLFHKAVRWHHHIQKEETLKKIKSHYSTIIWKPFTREKLDFLNWSFEELDQIEKIVEESQIFHHCLASAYIEQMLMRTYVAFHMWSEKSNTHLTLGCHVKDNFLEFDQLEYPHNQKAEPLLVDIACQFIDDLNRKRSSNIF
ncbi:hypothetical protein [Acinetobacter equi]|uniref:Uncharacterized protein n=1 Tax=Acinetobacter equi TaxID=1324350 RepID=A0A0N9VXV2_9GAMM|nr:hypothetical protein [Acinetobacter equi]ALH96189.1 hypothetical protein AOY20_11960 [Acinetobacter equi]